MSEQRNRSSGRALGILLVGIVAALAGYWLGRTLAPKDASQATGTAGAAAETLWTCSMHPQVIQKEPGLCPICHMALTPVGAKSGDGALAFDPAIVQSLGVRTARVTRASTARSVPALGVLMERDGDHRDVIVRVPGWIDTLQANADGLAVEKGDTLFTLVSPELTVAIEEWIAAARRSDEIGKTLGHAARAKLLFLGLDDEEIDHLATLERAPRAVAVKSPMDGHVTELEIAAGASVMPGERVLRLANNDVLWLVLRVSARDIAAVRPGARIEARVADGGSKLEAEVLFVHPHVDDATQAALVRAEVDNRDRRLREGQEVRAEIEVARAEPVLTVPRSGVIDTGRRHIAFVALGGGRFEPRELELGADLDAGLVAVRKGLQEGEEVVASGQFLLDTESRLRESLAKLRPAGSDVSRDTTPPRPAWAAAVDPLVDAYLALADKLGAEEESATPLDARAFVATARELVAKSERDPTAVAIASEAERFAAANLAAQREVFKRLSDLVLDLVTRVPPSADAHGPKLFVVKCPMAPGRWLQRDEHVKNPYYGTTMKECGEVTGALPLEKGRER